MSFFDQLQSRLGDSVIEQHQAKELWVRVEVGAWQQAARVCKEELGFTYFSFLSGLDWLPNPNLNGEKVYTDGPKPMGELITDPVIRVGGGTSRFQVFARVQNPDTNAAVFLLADLDDSLIVPSWVPVYRGADWHEREAWEMFGFEFDGHPNLRHLYLPHEFEGHPLRKDFPITSRVVRPWPGLVDMEDMPAQEPLSSE